MIQVNAEPIRDIAQGFMAGQSLTPESCEAIAAESRRMARLSTDPQQIALFLAQAIDMEARALQLRRDQPLVWSPMLALGHGDIDAGHLRLMEAINGVCASRYAQQLDKRLGRLKSEIDDHFGKETNLLREIKSGSYGEMRKQPPTPGLLKAIRDAALDEHILDHHTSLIQVRAIVSAAGQALCSGLKIWFIEHSTKHDAHLKAIFQAM